MLLMADRACFQDLRFHLSVPAEWSGMLTRRDVEMRVY